MTKLTATLFCVLLASAHADSLTFRNGAVVTGSWMGVNAKEVSFMVDGAIRTYPRSDVAKVTFGPATAPEKPELGMTIAQVVAILGQPDSIADAGAKQIYSYKDSKVTFTDGKVTAVQ